MAQFEYIRFGDSTQVQQDFFARFNELYGEAGATTDPKDRIDHRIRLLDVFARFYLARRT